jgi:hypothetical protein
MKTELIPLLQRIIARDPVIRAFDAENPPQSVLAYVRDYRFGGLSSDDQDLLEELPPFADTLSESFRENDGPDAAQYYLFNDGSLWLKTNAYSSVWADAADYVVEIILPRTDLSRIEAKLLRAIGMDDFFYGFAEIIERKRVEGPDAYLWAHDSGDVILWPTESESVDDNGRRAVARWRVDAVTLDALIASGEVDEIA